MRRCWPSAKASKHPDGTEHKDYDGAEREVVVGHAEGTKSSAAGCHLRSQEGKRNRECADFVDHEADHHRDQASESALDVGHHVAILTPNRHGAVPRIVVDSI